MTNAQVAEDVLNHDATVPGVHGPLEAVLLHDGQSIGGHSQLIMTSFLNVNAC
jgi:hypothetical protein